MKSKAKAQWYQSNTKVQPVMDADLAKEIKAFGDLAHLGRQAAIKIIKNELEHIKQELGLENKGK
jgi:hypothetical protein